MRKLSRLTVRCTHPLRKRVRERRLEVGKGCIMPRSSDRFEWNGHSLCVTLYSYASTYFHTTTEIKPATTASGSKATLPWPLYFSDDPRRERESLPGGFPFQRRGFSTGEFQRNRNTSEGKPGERVTDKCPRAFNPWVERKQRGGISSFPSLVCLFRSSVLRIHVHTHTGTHDVHVHRTLNVLPVYVFPI